MTYSMRHGLDEGLRRIAEQSHAMAVARSAAENILKVAKPLLIGKRYEPSKSGNLKGTYEITSVDIQWDGRINAYGRKVLSGGKLGRQSWGLGTIDSRTVWL